MAILRYGRCAVLALLAVALGGCVLERTGRLGGCPEGDLVCVVTERDFAFNAQSSAYAFDGRCEIRRDDGGSEFGDPLVQFRVRGEYDRKTFEFAESAKFSGSTDSTAALIGTSTLDPWIHPHHPVAIKSYAGNPQGLQQAFCVDGIPAKYSRLPFSRNVILYMMSNHERLLMAKAFSDAKDAPPPPPPPAPPCPLNYVMSPPTMHMPTEGLVYGEHVDGITVYLASKCGAPQVNYQDSRFQVVFEHFDNGWKPFRDFQVSLSYTPDGGSISSQTLPLGKTGDWRVKARQLVVQKHQSGPHVGDYGDWVPFRIGPPVYNAAQVDASGIQQIQVQGDRFERMDRRFRALRAEAPSPLQPVDSRRIEQQENQGRTLIRGPVND